MLARFSLQYTHKGTWKGLAKSKRKGLPAHSIKKDNRKRERERERGRQRGRDRERQRGRERFECTCVARNGKVLALHKRSVLVLWREGK